MKDFLYNAAPDFRVLFESLPGSFLVLLPDFTIAAVSNDYLQAAMSTREEILGRNVFDAFPDNPALMTADAVRDFRVSVQKVLKTKKADKMPTLRFDVQQRDDAVGTFLKKYWEILNSPVLDENGEVICFIVRGEEVTERVEAERRAAQQKQISAELNLEAQTARESLEQILSSITDSFYRFDRDFRYTYVNRATIEMFGISEKDFLDKTLWDLFPDVEGNRFHAELKRIVKEQKPAVFENYYPPLDRWFENRVYPSQDGLSVFTSEITARKKAELKLQETSAVLNAINLNTPTLIYVKDRESRMLSANPATCAVLGKSLPEIIGKSHAEYINNPVEGAMVHANDLQIVESGKTETFEETVTFADGSRHVFLSTKTPYRNQLGEIIGLIGVSVDITERKSAEEALRETQKRLEASLTGANLGVWTYNVQTGEFWADAHARQMHGYEPDDILTFEDAGSRIHPEDRERAEASIAQSIENCSKLQMENRIVRGDGSVQWIASYAEFASSSGAEMFYGVVQDITERKQAEERLRESEEKFRNLADNISQLAWMADASGSIFWYNERWYEYTGSTFDEMQGWGWQKVHDTDYVERVTDSYRQAVKAGEPWEETFPLRSKSGEFRWFLSRALPIRDKDGKIVRWFGTNTDVTEIRNTRRELEEANALLDTLFDQAPIGLGYWDEKLRFARVNPALAEMNGFSVEEHLGKTIAELLPQVADGVMEAFRHVVETGEAQVNLEAHGKTPADPDEYRYWNVSYYPINLQGKIAGVGAVCEEITERKKAEVEREKLLASERQARHEAETANRLKDEFLATVSHELRTPLNAMLGWATIVRQGDYQPETMRRAFEIVERNARNQEQIIADILDVSRIITGKLNIESESVELVSVIKAAIDTVRPAIEAKRINLVTDFADDVKFVTGDASRLQQVVWNLLSNAAKFTPEEGSIFASLKRGEGQFAEILVMDSGEGIEPEFLPFVFDRFRQAEGGSNRRHGGLGLGLAIVRNLVELHGGQVSVESGGKGQGTTFTVRLPLFAAVYSEQTNSGSQSDESKTPESENFSHNENDHNLAGLRILTVDDEPDALELLKIMLQSRGATVAIAASAVEALEKLQTAQFDILISDLGMPDVDGFDLIRKIKNSNGFANITAIALTAYARNEDSQRALSAGFAAHLPKPVKEDDLARTIINLHKA